MTSKSKTQQSCVLRTAKRKLYAAVSMVLVSAILVSTATYAWYSLSAAPEVVGVSATAAANGSLEIALGTTENVLNPGNIKSGVVGSSRQQTTTDNGWQGTTTTDNVLEANKSWGNVVDLSDPSYGLDRISLNPAVLNLRYGKIRPQPYSVATYGEDGRVAELLPITTSAVYDAETMSYRAEPTAYGVRAVGTMADSGLLGRLDNDQDKLQAALDAALEKFPMAYYVRLESPAQDYTPSAQDDQKYWGESTEQVTAKMQAYQQALEELRDTIDDYVRRLIVADASYLEQDPDQVQQAVQGLRGQELINAAGTVDEAVYAQAYVQLCNKLDSAITAAKDPVEQFVQETSGTGETSIIKYCSPARIKAALEPMAGAVGSRAYYATYKVKTAEKDGEGNPVLDANKQPVYTYETKTTRSCTLTELLALAADTNEVENSRSYSVVLSGTFYDTASYLAELVDDSIVSVDQSWDVSLVSSETEKKDFRLNSGFSASNGGNAGFSSNSVIESNPNTQYEEQQARFSYKGIRSARSDVNTEAYNIYSEVDSLLYLKMTHKWEATEETDSKQPVLRKDVEEKYLPKLENHLKYLRRIIRAYPHYLNNVFKYSHTGDELEAAFDYSKDSTAAENLHLCGDPETILQTHFEAGDADYQKELQDWNKLVEAFTALYNEVKEIKINQAKDPSVGPADENGNATGPKYSEQTVEDEYTHAVKLYKPLLDMDTITLDGQYVEFAAKEAYYNYLAAHDAQVWIPNGGVYDAVFYEWDDLSFLAKGTATIAGKEIQTLTDRFGSSQPFTYYIYSWSDGVGAALGAAARESGMSDSAIVELVRNHAVNPISESNQGLYAEIFLNHQLDTLLQNEQKTDYKAYVAKLQTEMEYLADTVVPEERAIATELVLSTYQKNGLSQENTDKARGILEQADTLQNGLSQLQSSLPNADLTLGDRVSEHVKAVRKVQDTAKSVSVCLKELSSRQEVLYADLKTDVLMPLLGNVEQMYSYNTIDQAQLSIPVMSSMFSLYSDSDEETAYKNTCFYDTPDYKYKAVLEQMYWYPAKTNSVADYQHEAGRMKIHIYFSANAASSASGQEYDNAIWQRYLQALPTSTGLLYTDRQQAYDELSAKKDGILAAPMAALTDEASPDTNGVAAILAQVAQYQAQKAEFEKKQELGMTAAGETAPENAKAFTGQDVRDAFDALVKTYQALKEYETALKDQIMLYSAGTEAVDNTVYEAVLRQYAVGSSQDMCAAFGENLGIPYTQSAEWVNTMLTDCAQTLDSLYVKLQETAPKTDANGDPVLDENGQQKTGLVIDTDTPITYTKMAELFAPLQNKIGVTVTVETNEETGAATGVSAAPDYTTNKTLNRAWSEMKSLQTDSSDGCVKLAAAVKRPVGTEAAANQTAAKTIMETYGFAIDLMFRTNAQNASLMLQTDARQRIYDGNTTSDTMGGGSTVTVNTEGMSTEQISDMLNALRFVFADTKTGEIYACAVLDTNDRGVNEDGIVCDLELCDFTYRSDNTLKVLDTQEDTKAQRNASGDLVITPMLKNQIKSVTVWAYLDGEKVHNSMASQDAKTRLMLNLQFATDEELHPAEVNNF